MAGDSMDDDGIAAYVDAACALQGLTLDAAERERAVLQFRRLAAIAAPLMAAALEADVEVAPVYRP